MRSSSCTVKEDKAYLTEQLLVVKASCEKYDGASACAAIDRLKAKQWQPTTTAMLDDIHDALFLHSDFDGVADKIEGCLLIEETLKSK